MPELAEGQTVELKDILKDESLPAASRYTEATLIRAMEERA